MMLYSIWSYTTNGAFKWAFTVQEAISPYLVSRHTETGKAALQKTSHHTTSRTCPRTSKQTASYSLGHHRHIVKLSFRGWFVA